MSRRLIIAILTIAAPLLTLTEYAGADIGLLGGNASRAHRYESETTIPLEEMVFEFTADETLGSPIVADDSVYIAADYSYIYVVDSETGDLERSLEIEAESIGSPTIVDETAYVGTEEGHLVAVEVNSGEPRWTFNTSEMIGYSPVVKEGTVYFGNFDGNFYAVDADDGTGRWVFQREIITTLAPAIREESVYAKAGERIYSIDTSTGAEQWSGI